MNEETLEDLSGRHSLHLTRYGSYTLNQILNLLERVDSRITLQIAESIEGMTEREIAQFLAGKYTTRRLIALRENIRELAANTRRSTSQIIGDNGKALAGYELEFTQQMLTAQGLSLGETVSITQAYAAATSRPFQGRLIKERVADLEPEWRKKILAEIREGFIAGEGSMSIVRRIKGRADQKFRDGLFFRRNGAIEGLVRTSLAHIANTARLEEFRAADVDQVWLLTVLDGRQSKICAAWNVGGEIKYYDREKAPRPPFHDNCRTILMAKSTSDETLTKPFVADSRSVKDIPKSEREGKIGRTKASTFEVFFKRQPVAFQREWLGPSRYKLWKDGGIPLTKFADPRKRKTYNLAELRQIDAQAFIDAGL